MSYRLARPVAGLFDTLLKWKLAWAEIGSKPRRLVAIKGKVRLQGVQDTSRLDRDCLPIARFDSHHQLRKRGMGPCFNHHLEPLS